MIFGNGTIGRRVAGTICARGDAVTIAQRNAPTDAPPRAEFVGVRRARSRSRCGAPSKAHRTSSCLLPSPTTPHLASTHGQRRCRTCSTRVRPAGARLVFVDNLYQLGPQNAPRTEDMPLSSSGQKAAILSDVTRMWTGATDRVRVAALRCTDFYGPGVVSRRISDPNAFGAVARGKAGVVAGTAGHSARLRLCTRHRPRGGHAARRTGRRVRPGVEHAVRDHAHAARDPADRCRRARAFHLKCARFRSVCCRRWVCVAVPEGSR